MESLLTLDLMLHLVGVIALIEILLIVAVKPVLRWRCPDAEERPWYGVVINGSSFVLGLGGSLLASWGLKLFTPELFASQILMAIEATFVVTGGYEAFKHVKRVMTS